MSGNGAPDNWLKRADARWYRWCRRCNRKHTANEGCKFRG